MQSKSDGIEWKKEPFRSVILKKLQKKNDRIIFWVCVVLFVCWVSVAVCLCPLFGLWSHEIHFHQFFYPPRRRRGGLSLSYTNDFNLCVLVLVRHYLPYKIRWLRLFHTHTLANSKAYNSFSCFVFFFFRRRRSILHSASANVVLNGCALCSREFFFRFGLSTYSPKWDSSATYDKSKTNNLHFYDRVCVSCCLFLKTNSISL